MANQKRLVSRPSELVTMTRGDSKIAGVYCRLHAFFLLGIQKKTRSTTFIFVIVFYYSRNSSASNSPSLQSEVV